MEGHYTVKTDVFEGPLDLLLSLIEKRKLFINDISLASVTDDFVAYINEHKTFPVPEAAHFIFVAATLLLIKSRSLLPTLSLSEEEEHDIKELERRLGLYKYFKKVSRHIRERFGVRILFARAAARAYEPVFSPDTAITKDAVHAGIQSVLANMPAAERDIPKKLVQKVISIDEMISRLTERITKHTEASFRKFSGMGKAEKAHVIVSFLALLELVKQGIVAVRQDELFSDITMEPPR